MIRRISILLFIGLCWGQEIVEIKTGSFFGMCLGYCLSELTITESQADYNIYGWDENDPVYLPVEISDSVDSTVWEDLNTEFNFELFMSLDSIIGCPDCVDGGAEWFEIVTSDTLKRVTIEYGDSLNGLDSYINLLRTIRQSFEEIQKCYYTPNPGVCLAAITKYYFDQEENECLEFTWGGCGGLVPFETLEDCELSCIDDGQQLSTHISHYPVKYELKNCYPNPFNPVTSLRYDLPEDGLVNITIYDMMGRIVKTLVNSSQTAGYKSIRWNATNDRNEPVSAGLYLYTIQAGEFRQTKKMVLLK
jgi:hypothetical protein